MFVIALVVLSAFGISLFLSFNRRSTVIARENQRVNYDIKDLVKNVDRVTKERGDD